MDDLLIIDTKVIVVIISTLALCLGYFYRWRIENKKNRKIALYYLLEVWHRLSIFSKTSFSEAFDELGVQLKLHLPDITFPPEELEQVKKHFDPILIAKTREVAASDLSDIEESFQEAIALIASDDPIFAYELNSSGKTKKLLSFIEDYINDSVNDPIDGVLDSEVFRTNLKSKMTDKAMMESVSDLESDILKLSAKISIFTYFRCKRVIKKRRDLIAEVDTSQIDELMQDILIPLIKEMTSNQPSVKN